MIAIDLGGGSYYSLAGSGTAVWAMLVGGASREQLCAALGARFDAAPEAIEEAVEALLAQLLENALVIEVEGDAAAGEPAANGERAPFDPPRFERYTDMKDYFLLDPIHEVDAAGWPKPAA